MKKIALLLLAANLMISPAIAEDDPVIATYIDEGTTKEVKFSDVREQFKNVIEAQFGKDTKLSDLDSKIQQQLTYTTIATRILEREAEKSGIENTKDFRGKMEISRKQLLSKLLVEKQVKALVPEDMIDKEYNKYVESLKSQEEVKVSHILVSTEKEAKEIKKKLSKGKEDFAAIAKEHSQDQGSKINGGELGYVLKGQLVPEFEEKAFAMKKNEISEPVKTQFGYHIIKVLDKRPAQVPSKESERPVIEAKLSHEATSKYIQDLMDKAKAKIDLPSKKSEGIKDNSNASDKPAK